MPEPDDRPCRRCGLPVRLLSDSWTRRGGALEHVTCPESEAISALPTLDVSQEQLLQPPPLAPPPDFLTMDEAGKLLRVSKDTIRNRIRRGELPAKRLKDSP